MLNKNYNPITGNRLFAGPSDQEKAAEGLYNELGGVNSSVRNRFNSYSSPYSFEKMSSNVDDIFGGYEDMINRETKDLTDEQQKGAASSMASRGITGGSVLTDTQSKVASDINKSKTNALANLGVKKSGVLSDLMQYFNNMDFAKTRAASDVDFGNVGNMFTKYGLRTNALGGLSDDTWLDDLFAGMNAAGNLAKGVGAIVGGGG